MRGDDEFINPNNPHCFYFNRCLLDFVSGQQKRVFNKNPEHVLLFNSRFLEDTIQVLCFFFRYYKLINKQSKHYIYAPLKLGSVTMIICKHVDCVKLFLTNLILFILSEINYEIVSIGIAIYVYKGFS